jgi:hypothetical protein
MAIRVSIESVLQPRYLNFSGIEKQSFNPSGDPVSMPVFMEVYTGWVEHGFRTTDLHEEEVRTFLPFAPMKIMSYEAESDLLDVTVTAAPTLIQPGPTQPVLFGLLEASVKLEPQLFLGVGGEQLCLVLRVDLVGINVQILRITYQVTMMYVAGVMQRATELGPLAADTKPA